MTNDFLRKSYCFKHPGQPWIVNMMRMFLLYAGLLAGLLLAASCRLAPGQRAGHREAERTNAISNKHTVTDSPTLERAAPQVVPGP